MNLLDLARAALPHPSLQVTSEPVRQWRISYPNASAITVLFTPAATRADVAAIYPGATIEPIPNAAKLPATTKQVDELRELIDAVLAGRAEAEATEALTVACSDTQAALISLRSLRDEQRENAKWLGGRYV